MEGRKFKTEGRKIVARMENHYREGKSIKGRKINTGREIQYREGNSIQGRKIGKEI